MSASHGVEGKPFTSIPLRYGIAFVILITCASLLLSAQGWRAQLPAFDLLTYMYAARDFLETGRLPQHGDTGSYGSYKPPGTAWLMVPGTALFGDPRAVAYVGTGLLHLATLLGLFLLARRSFGMWTAGLAVLLYGLSRHGIFLAGSLWPNGRPDFFVWFVLFSSLWVLRRDGRFLAAALTVWGLGMHVDMGIAPALFILPIVWLLYRPPVRPLPVLVAGLVVLTVWSPYLRLQATRGFADLKSQLLLRYMLPEDYRRSWCDPRLTLATWLEPEASGGSGSGAVTASSPRSPPTPGLLARLTMVKDKVLSNFTGAVRVPGVNVLLLVLVLGACLLCVASGTAEDTMTGRSPPRWRSAPAAGLLIAGGLVLYAITSGHIPGAALLPASGVVRKLPQVLCLVGLTLLAWPWLVAATQRLLRRFDIDLRPSLSMRLLVISLLVPWAILVILAEPGKPERFWWLWPLQLIFLSASVAYFLPRLRAPRLVVAAAQAALVALILLNSTLLGRVRGWREDGWQGQEPEAVQALDFVAEQIRATGRSQAAIGYQVFMYPFMAEYHVTNPIYRVGAELEVMLRYRHSIANTNRCAEGISPLDEYRIVQTRPKQEPGAPTQYFDVRPDPRFRLLRRFGSYEVHQRG